MKGYGVRSVVHQARGRFVAEEDWVVLPVMAATAKEEVWEG